MTPYLASEVMTRVRERFRALYGDQAVDRCVSRLEMMIGSYGVASRIGEEAPPRWDQRDAVLITYADMVRAPGEPSLRSLHRFALEHLSGAVRILHLLPFYPSSSDDGFSVIDYLEVNPDYGKWEDLEPLGKDFSLMFDLVLNHVSARSAWFTYYSAMVAPYRRYFHEIPPDTDLSAVVRPRSHPLLTRVQTRAGERFVWTTFSEDQVDLNFANPDVLFEFLHIVFYYLYRGARILRLDAIAYLWKAIGTTCIHRPQTHEVVKLLRDVVSMVAPGVLLLTETNVPHPENLSYFGQGDEAHMVYQFTLPPLLLHALLRGTSRYLTPWAGSLGDPPPGCTFLNFTASHDGIGVRPLEGILPAEEFEFVIERVRSRGGHVSGRSNPDGSQSPYELNITYFDALCGEGSADQARNVARFLCSQTVPMALRGMPAYYFNSLMAAPNYHDGVKLSGFPRSINREKWDEAALGKKLADPAGHAGEVLRELTRRLRIRALQPAFHPDAPQSVHAVSDALFVVERRALDGSQTLFCIHNLSPDGQVLPIRKALGGAAGGGPWNDLLAGASRGDGDGALRIAPYETCWLAAG